MKTNRKVCVVGIIFGVVMAICGALIFFEAIDFGIFYTSAHKTGFAEFGADFYTYTVNNIEEVSVYTYRAMRLLLKILGAFLFSSGMFDTLFFAAIKGTKSNKTIDSKEEALSK